MEKKKCPNCGNEVLLNVCEHCGYEMLDLSILSIKEEEINQEEIILTTIKPDKTVKTTIKRKPKKKNNIRDFSSRITVPFNKDNVFSQSETHLRNLIDFKPYTYKELFKKMEVEKFSLKPVEYLIFSLKQEFLYRNKQEIYEMDYNNALLTINSDKMQIYKKSPFTQSLEDTLFNLKSQNIDYVIGDFSKPRVNKNSLKKKIREATSEFIQYVGLNGHYYEKNLIPNLSNIKIHKQGILYLWGCSISTKFKNTSEFKVRVINGKLDPSISFGEKKVTCKICKIFLNPNRKKVCNYCKSTLCNNCSEEKTIFRFFKGIYCPECVSRGLKKDKKEIKILLLLVTASLILLLSMFGFYTFYL
ncbi:MAG: hypothetical protein ACTSWX_09255 [Promethearchaeota archaeon]